MSKNRTIIAKNIRKYREKEGLSQDKLAKKSEKSKMFFWVVVAAVLGGGVPPFSKIGLQIIPTFLFILLRFLIAGTALLPVFILKKEKVEKKSLLPLLLVSLFGTGNVTLFALGVQKTSATVGQVLYAAVPIIAALLSLVILKTSISRRKTLGVLVGFLGVLIIIFAPKIGQSGEMGTLLGNLLIFGAVFSYSLYTVFSKKLLRGNSPLVLTLSMVVTTILVQLVLTFTTSSLQLSQIASQELFKAILSLIYVGLLGTASYFLLYQRVIKKADPLIASMVFYLQPISSFFWSALLLGERLTLGLVVGGILALTGAGLVTRKVSSAPFRRHSKTV